VSGFIDLAGLEFKRRELAADERVRLLEKVKVRLEGLDEVLFAYAYGSFIGGASFRDLDIAVWLGNPGKAFYYTVDFSATLGLEVGVPVDVQVLNEAPLPFKFNVYTRGRLLFSKDDHLRLRLVDEALREYMDLKLLREITLKLSGNMKLEAQGL